MACGREKRLPRVTPGQPAPSWTRRRRRRLGSERREGLRQESHNLQDAHGLEQNVREREGREGGKTVLQAVRLPPVVQDMEPGARGWLHAEIVRGREKRAKMRSVDIKEEEELNATYRRLRVYLPQLAGGGVR